MQGRPSSVIRAAVCGLVVVMASACATLPRTADTAAARRYRAAWSALESAAPKAPADAAYHRRRALIRAPAFETLPEASQHDRLLRTALIGMRLRDFAGAHALALRSSAMQTAGIDDWRVRAESAYLIHDGLDAERALTHIAHQWPGHLSTIPAQLVRGIVVASPKDETGRRARYRLLNTLYDAGWTDQYGMAPAALWGELTMDLAERGHLERALRVAAHVDSARAMLALRCDKRFDALVRLDPQRFDIEAAGAREVSDWLAAVARYPSRLDPLVQLTYALIDVNHYDLVYRITSAAMQALADTHALGGLSSEAATSFNWILDNQARALEAAQKWNDAEWDLRNAADRRENGMRNISNVINLAQFEADLGRGRDAAGVLATLPEGDAKLSPYGRMQWYMARLSAAVAEGDERLAGRCLAYLHGHRADAPGTYQAALVRANRLDAAAKLLIQRLRNPLTRQAALADVQDYVDPPAPPQLQLARNRWHQLVQRGDVHAAIERVGRVLHVGLSSPLS